MSDRIHGSARASRSFGKECTVVIDVKDVKKIKTSHIIRCVEELTGDMSVYAVVPKGANLYEVTLPNKEVAYNILSGIDIGNAQSCTCYSEDIAKIHSQVDDVTRVIQHDAEDIQHDADDKKEIENAKQQDESGKSSEENDRSNVELTNEEIE
ncbi:hypothetical protein ACJMK2_000728 [Sinanodonta woodiana]|uniref:Uncharacterized protein n=1 Tax=Sinanodonta woodiana TaxID=1069815 RepID=A0ABD3XTM2_SINWO